MSVQSTSAPSPRQTDTQPHSHDSDAWSQMDSESFPNLHAPQFPEKDYAIAKPYPENSELQIRTFGHAVTNRRSIGNRQVVLAR